MSDPKATSNPPADAIVNPTPVEASSTGDTGPFDEYRKKLVAQITDLGQHVESLHLQQSLTSAVNLARSAIEKEVSTLKDRFPEAFTRIEQLRATGDESIDHLRIRLDKLTGDMELAVGNFLGAIAVQAKKAASTHLSSDSQAPSETPPPADKP